MASWKKVVVSGSAISQLNNDSNYVSSTGAGILSGSAQIAADISGSLSAAAIVALGANIVSSSGQVDGASITNNTVSFGGVSVALNGSDSTPAFDLSDATDYPGDSSLVTVGALDAGSITSGFGNIDIGTSTINAGNVTVDTLKNDSAVGSSHLTGSFTGSFVGDGSGLTGVVASGTLSSSAQIADDISGSLSNSAIAGLGGGHISASSFSSPSQGTVRATINGVNTDVDTGLQTGDSPTFTNLTLTGDLEVQGTTTTIDSTTLDIGDNIIALNGTGAALGGLHVNDANGPASGSLLWDGTNNRWIAGASGSEVQVALLLGQGLLSASAQVDGASITNNSVSFGGVSVSLNGSDATPAFDLSDATDYPGDSSLVTVGALNAGSITSGFGNVDIGTSTFNAGNSTVDNFTNNSAVSDSHFTGSFSGSFNGVYVGDGSGLTGVVASGTISSSAQIADDISGSLSAAAIVSLGANIVSSSAQTILNVAAGGAGIVSSSAGVANLGAGIVSASVLSSPSQGTIRLATNGVNTDVDSGLQTGDSPTFAGLTLSGAATGTDLTLSGNLTVNGTVTNINTDDLSIEDKFILLNSGSSSGNSGIIAQNSATMGVGTALFFDDTENRWSLDYAGANANTDSVTADARIAAVALSESDANYQKDGNIFVSSSGDVFIYVE